MTAGQSEPRPLSQHLPAAIGSQRAESSTAEQRSEQLDAVEWLFGRFTLHYGGTRMAAFWSGQDPEAAKRYWAKRLSGMQRRTVEYGLAHLPDYPPTVDEFSAVCNRCPPPEVLRLERKRTDEEIHRGADCLAAIKRRFRFGRADV